MKMNPDIKELKELCRVCLMLSNDMRPLLDPKGAGTQLMNKLSSIIHSEINLNLDNSQPQYICSTCEDKLITFYEFQQMCIKSHQTILEYSNETNINVDVKPFYVDLINCDDVKKESEDVPLTYEKSESKFDSIEEDCNEYDNDDNGLHETDDDDEDNVNSTTNSKSTKRVFVCNTEEVKNIINEVKKKFYTSRQCLFCGFTSSNVRTLSVHMSRLHWSVKDKWCWKCNKIEENLKEHTEIHKDDFKCPFCNKQSTTGSHFVEHLSRHTIKQRHVCKICKKHLKTTKLLKAHCKKVHKKLIETCNVCLDTFFDKKLLEKHLEIHKTTDSDACDNQFSEENKALLSLDEEDNEENNTHKKSNNRQNRYCDICKRTVRNLSNHVQKHHSSDNTNEEPKALCHYCGKLFKQQSNLDVHIRTHTKETPYKCSYCDMCVATRTRLVDHERTHTGEKPFACKFCGKTFKQHGVLNTHLKIHTGRPEQCLLCPKRFCRPSELRNHMRVHTGEKPYACSFCDKCFIQRSHLVEHTKIHTYHRPFKCHICGKAFKQSSTLKGHLNVHEGKKMFKCNVCSYSCKKNYTLKQHLLQHQNANADESFSCELCQEKFLNVDLLNQHKNIHLDSSWIS
ncbi:unnamed protein product [Phyllotreta striolata]|uniref:Zinc finger protein 865 n=1 Tax=Phyllotreta striolata TaxID=444603 RepID=A0A9N9TNQ0_PHYSR|nr:unnamed protein product [Phyllotreta striolata]